MRKAHRILFLLAVLLGFGFRLAFVHADPFGSDVQLFVRWGRLVAGGGLRSVYTLSPSAYPPLGTALLLPVGWMCPQCAPDAPVTSSELFALRWLCSAFDLLNMVLLVYWGCLMRHSRRGVAAAALYGLFPVMPLVAGWWGQSDSWYVCAMLVAGMALSVRRPLPAWIALGLAVLIKFQAIILLPVFAAATWRWFGPKKLLVAGLVFVVVLGLAAAPALLGGYGEDFVKALLLPIQQDPVQNRSHITLGGHNLWAGVALWRGLDIWGPYTHTVTGNLSFYVAGMSLLALALGAVTTRIFVSSSPRMAFAAMALLWVVFFQCAVGVGFRYLIPAVVFLLAAAVAEPVWWIPAGGLLAGTLYNLQETVGAARYPFVMLPLPGGLAANVSLVLFFSALAGVVYFSGWRGEFTTEVRRARSFWGKVFAAGPLRRAGGAEAPSRASRFELLLIVAGWVAVVVLVGWWVGAGVRLQGTMTATGVALREDLERELAGATHPLVINWPKEVLRAPSGAGVASPGLFEPSLPDLGYAQAEALIFAPWTAALQQPLGWDVDYHGQYVTGEALAQRALAADRILVTRVLAGTPTVVRLVETAPLDGTAPVAEFGDAVQLMRVETALVSSTLLVYPVWNVAQPLSETVTVFVQALGADGQLLAQADGGVMDNLLPLSALAAYPDRTLKELRVLHLPDAPGGAVTLAIGLYRNDTLERLPAVCSGAPCGDAFTVRVSGEAGERISESAGQRITDYGLRIADSESACEQISGSANCELRVLSVNHENR